jgi:3-dehydroquinate synthase
MKTLSLDLGERSYPIHIGGGIIADASLYAPHTAGAHVLIVSNDVVGPLYADRVVEAVAGSSVHAITLADGEASKTLATLEQILDHALSVRLPRDGVIVALGGGVVGDVAGLAAATYQRGIRFVQVPTTLLAQVDSSVGGKTAVNHPRGKNMIGAFHQPACVIADTDVLSTLPQREFAAGLAEVVKYGLIRDPEFFDWLERNVNALMGRSADALVHAIERSCHNKAEVVAVDEREGGARAILNLGHTFGHAIEAGMGYGTWLHGEAVAAGMCMAAELSCREGWLDPDSLDRTRALLRAMGLPVRAPAELSPARMLELMQLDKKVLSGQLRLVLLRSLGEAVVSSDFSPARLQETLESCREAG